MGKSPLTNEEKQQTTPPTRERANMIGQNNINTWTSANGQVQRQIDYIMRNVQNTPRKHLTIWCAGAKGQIGKIRHEEGKPKIIIFGTYAKQDKEEKEMGEP